MAGADSWAPALALNLIKQFGVSATLERKPTTFGAGGTFTGSALGPVTIKVSPPKVRRFPLGDTTLSMQSASESMVAANDPGLTFAPQPGDVLTVAGAARTLLADPPIEIVYSGDSIALYRMRWAS